MVFFFFLFSSGPKISHFFLHLVCSVLVGDMNSVYQKDYHAHQWKKIEDMRKESKWEPPQTEVMNLLLENIGYRDACPPTEEQKAVKVSTCWAGTVHRLLSPLLRLD
jgi:exonuclease III